MKPPRILFAWGITILSGSVIIPVAGSLIAGEISAFVLLFMFVSFIISGLSSSPALAAMMTVSAMNADKPYRTRFRRVIWTHVLAFLCTLLIGNLYIYVNIQEYTGYQPSWPIRYAEMIFLTEIMLGYGVVAAVVWILVFRKEWKEGKNN